MVPDSKAPARKQRVLGSDGVDKRFGGEREAAGRGGEERAHRPVGPGEDLVPPEGPRGGGLREGERAPGPGVPRGAGGRRGEPAGPGRQAAPAAQ